MNALLALAEHGTFSAAADSLHTVQSNVSAHVARLEKELGASLFDRSTARLTVEGEAVVRRARRVLSEIEAAKSDVAELRNEVIGGVQIGLIGTTARWIVPQVMRLMSERHPLVYLRISEGTSTALEPRLSSGALDLAVILLPSPSPDLITEELFEEDMVLVVPRDHHLAAYDEIDLTKLAGIGLLLPPMKTAARAEIDAAARAVGVSLYAKAEVDGVRLTASLTFDGFGPALLPATALPSYLNEQWTLVRVQGIPRRRVGLAYQRRAQPSATARAVRDVLIETVAAGAELHPGLYPATSTQ